MFQMIRRFDPTYELRLYTIICPDHCYYTLSKHFSTLKINVWGADRIGRDHLAIYAEQKRNLKPMDLP